MNLLVHKHRKIKTSSSESKEKPPPRPNSTSHKRNTAKDLSSSKDLRNNADLKSTLNAFQPPPSMISLCLRKTQTAMLRKRPVRRRMELFGSRL